MKSKKIKTMVYTAAFAAMICVTTAFILHIPVGNGYVHVGDGIIYLAASILPFPFGLIAASVGGGLSDLLTGYLQYVIPTIIIKSLNASCFYFGRRSGKLYSARRVIVSVISGCITVVGYYIAAIFLYGNTAAIATIPPSIFQATASTVLYCILAFALDRVHFNDKILNN